MTQEEREARVRAARFIGKDPHVVAVLVALASLEHSHTETCCTTMGELADLSGLSRGAVCRVLGRLERRGLLHVLRMQGYPSLYTVAWGRLA